MISVCIATYKGEKYLRGQLESILSQLGKADEIVISDNGSTDATLGIIHGFNDPRIKVYPYTETRDLIRNFENALSLCRGEYIFLADQDDVWEPEKIEKMISALERYDLVLSDCRLIDADGMVFESSFFKINHSKKGLFPNLAHNAYLGCCMAFRRKVLTLALPFPADIPMHDIWIGFVAELFFSTHFMEEKLVRYRRHGANASSSSEKSRASLFRKLLYRYRLIKYLPLLLLRKLRTKKQQA